MQTIAKRHTVLTAMNLDTEKTNAPIIISCAMFAFMKNTTAYCPFVLYSANVEPQESVAPWKKDQHNQTKGKASETRTAEQQALALEANV